ncbi:MFS transporter [Acrocarpospora macrocephala]|uniref:MFS transporter n=1 Tax=Acrocarpospora macrocephala TaxID=150177 RepID=A0A5M3WLF8_9ACTN|nr:MFS transporter [Acrocarpospora macrocephala]GES08999.1 MFS transporter [Acrocarpospora macrocephala]
MREYDVQPRIRKRVVLLIATAVFGQELIWNFYDAQVPAELRRYVTSAGLIGLIMGIDNVLGVFVQPWMGYLSDRHRARHGNRLIFIVVGAPLAAVPLVFLPWASSLPVLIVLIVGFAFIANSFRPVVESQLADFVPPPQRSTANGFAKLAVALTVVVAALISLTLVDEHIELAFAIPAVLLVAALWTASAGLRRQHPTAAEGAGAGRIPKMRHVLREIVQSPDRARLLILVGVFGYNATWQGLRSLFTPYAIEVLDISRGTAGSLGIAGAFAFFVVAAPIALFSQRVGQLRMIWFGALVFLGGLLFGGLLHTVPMTVVGLAIAAMGFAAFAVNAIIALWNAASTTSVTGLYTGLYAIAYAAGGAAGPALLGFTVDLTGWPLMMINAAVLFLPVLWILNRLARGDRSSPRQGPQGGSPGRDGG